MTERTHLREVSESASQFERFLLVAVEGRGHAQSSNPSSTPSVTIPDRSVTISKSAVTFPDRPVTIGRNTHEGLNRSLHTVPAPVRDFSVANVLGKPVEREITADSEVTGFPIDECADRGELYAPVSDRLIVSRA